MGTETLPARTMGAGKDGSAKTAQMGPRMDFDWVPNDEPHATRRKEILAKYPQVNKLMGHCPMTKYIVTGLVSLQVFLAWATMEWSWAPYLAVIYVVGATTTHALFLAIHELAHNLGFKKPNHNRYFAMFANIPIAIPYCIAFKGYHIEHHKYQGVDGIDTDVPTPLEGRVITGKFTKFLFCFCQILFYALRPMCVKLQEFTKMHALNWALQFSFDATLVYFF